MTELDPADEYMRRIHDRGIGAEFTPIWTKDTDERDKVIRSQEMAIFCARLLLEERQQLCADAYQAVGRMADAMGHFDAGGYMPAVDNLLTRLEQGSGYDEIEPASPEVFSVAVEDEP